MTAQTVAQISMAVWLLLIAGTFGYQVLYPRSVKLGVAQTQRVALYGLAGVIGEAVTLLVAGTWS